MDPRRGLLSLVAQLFGERGVAVGTHTMFPLGSTTGKPIDPAALSAQDPPDTVDSAAPLGSLARPNTPSSATFT